VQIVHHGVRAVYNDYIVGVQDARAIRSARVGTTHAHHRRKSIVGRSATAARSVACVHRDYFRWDYFGEWTVTVYKDAYELYNVKLIITQYTRWSGVLHATTRLGQLARHRRKYQSLRNQHVYYDRDIRARAHRPIHHQHEYR
jgi:hypothetical protein